VEPADPETQGRLVDRRRIGARLVPSARTTTAATAAPSPLRRTIRVHLLENDLRLERGFLQLLLAQNRLLTRAPKRTGDQEA
jgi:hypothetical protein